jgi:hypothetical protein
MLGNVNTNARLESWLVRLLCFLLLLGGEARLPALTLGDKVEANTLAYVEQTPGGLFEGIQPSGSEGYLSVGPQNDFWYVIFSTTPSGWVAARDLTAIPPSAPTLDAPGTATTPGPTIEDLSPALSWNPTIGATNYAVSVYDLTTSSMVYSNNNLGNVSSVTLNPLPAGNSFWWAAQASDSAGFSPLSTPFYFQTVALAVATPVLTSPGGLIAPGPTIANVYPEMVWAPAANATNYGLYLNDLTSGTLVYSNDNVGNITTLNFPTALTAGHHFRWDMRASNSGGFSGYSPFLYFAEQSPALADVSLSSSNISMTVSGVSPGLAVLLQSSTDLATWRSFQTTSAAGTTLTLSTPVNPSLPAQFFRVLVP